jgi:hypothetical protein
LKYRSGEILGALYEGLGLALGLLLNVMVAFNVGRRPITTVWACDSSAVSVSDIRDVHGLGSLLPRTADSCAGTSSHVACVTLGATGLRFGQIGTSFH